MILVYLNQVVLYFTTLRLKSWEVTTSLHLAQNRLVSSPWELQLWGLCVGTATVSVFYNNTPTDQTVDLSHAHNFFRIGFAGAPAMGNANQDEASHCDCEWQIALTVEYLHIAPLVVEWIEMKIHSKKRLLTSLVGALRRLVYVDICSAYTVCLVVQLFGGNNGC